MFCAPSHGPSMVNPSLPATNASSSPPATEPYAVSMPSTLEYGYLSYWAKKFASDLAPGQLARSYLPGRAEAVDRAEEAADSKGEPARLVDRVEADLLQLAAGDLPLLGLVGVELGQRGGRRGDPGRLQHRLVVVERPGVHRHRQRVQRPVVLAALQRDRVQPLLQAGVRAGQVRLERLDRAVRRVLAEHRVPLGEHVRRVAGRDLGQQLRVPGRARDVGLGDVDARVGGVELVDHLAEQRQRVARPHGLPGEVHHPRRRSRRPTTRRDRNRPRGPARRRRRSPRARRPGRVWPGSGRPAADAPVGAVRTATAQGVYLLNHEMLLS